MRLPAWVRACSAGLLGAFGALVARISAADDPPPLGCRLEWVAPPGCPDGEQVRRDIERLTGRRLDPAAADAAAVTATVEEKGPGRWAVDVVIARPAADSNDRHLEGRTCREVSDAAAVIVAIALDPSSALAESPPPPLAPPPPPPVAVKPKPAPPRVVQPRPMPTRREWGIAAIGGVDVAALPSPALGAGLAGAFVYGDNRFELRASAWLPQDEALDASSGVEVGLFAGAVAYCRALVGRRRVLELSACAAFEAGVLRASGYGLQRNDTGFGRWFAPQLGLLALVRAAPPFALSLEVDGLVPLVRERFLVDTVATYRPAVVDGRALLGLRLEGL